MKILLIEDDDRIAEPLTEHLKNQYHVVDVADDGVAGWEQAQAFTYDLILLDLMLPHLDGITLCKRLRASGYKSFILMLTAKDTTTDRVIGLDAGADDYLVKPFKLQELTARIRALSRRIFDIRQNILIYENLQLDTTNYQVTYKGNLLSLTPKEYMLLEVFLKSPTRVFTRMELLDKLWDCNDISGEETVKTHLKNVRRKLKAVGCESEIIENVHGIGYRYTLVNGTVEITNICNNQQIEITVKDTGIGMTPEQLQHIFERFWRADTARSYRAGGFGLGLAIAKGFVENHGGNLTVSSKPNVGSCFIVSLPASRPI
jgi:two-component system, OmpR family, response regulator QseB